jgi:hypothetical protein
LYNSLKQTLTQGENMSTREIIEIVIEILEIVVKHTNKNNGEEI